MYNFDGFKESKNNKKKPKVADPVPEPVPHKEEDPVPLIAPAPTETLPEPTNNTSGGNNEPVNPTLQPPTQPNNEIIQNQHNKEAIIAEIMNMGFDRPQIEQALRAAYFNKERAIDYLLNGIPENLISDLSSNI